MLFSATMLIGLLFAIFVAFISIMRFRRARTVARHKNIRRCTCGYPLQNLEVPRCPECGLLAGFRNLKVTDIGLTEEQLLEHAKKRRPQ